LRERLERHGFVSGPRETLLMFDLSQWTLPVQPGIEVRRAHTPSEVELFRRLAEQIFESDNAQVADELLRSLEHEEPEQFAYVAFDAGVPASIGRLERVRGSAFAGLFTGGTLREHRGRGLYRALVAARARDAVGLGARYLRVDALPTSQPILEGLGFVSLTRTWPCVLARL
jgi:GNAT superfamily N-acetyltransferase